MLREIEVQRQFRHPHIMRILDAAEDEDDPWFVMPVARGNRHRMCSFSQTVACAA
jgi:serine/threonine protein kinase